MQLPGSSSHIGTATLREDGTIAGIASPNETFWLIDGEGRLIFKHRDGRVSTIFNRAEKREGKWFFSGPFQFREGVLHVLEETPAAAAAGESDDQIARLIRAYSKQQIVRLDPGEVYRFVSGHGLTKTIRLVTVEDHRDSVIKLMRRADVRIEIDGQPLDLVCAPDRGSTTTTASIWPGTRAARKSSVPRRVWSTRSRPAGRTVTA